MRTKSSPKRTWKKAVNSKWQPSIMFSKQHLINCRSLPKRLLSRRKKMTNCSKCFITRTNWPKTAHSSTLAAYFTHRNRLSEIKGCLLMGDRVVIPAKLRQRILTTLHFTHPGIVRMKNLAKQFVYWPKIDLNIDRWVRNCEECALAAKAPPKVPLQPWPASTQVYERLHMDFAGPCADGNKYLVVVDSFSKWPEIIKIKSTTAHLLIEQFVWLFSRYGFPKKLSQTMAPIQSHEIFTFCSSHGIQQTFASPFHPQSNGRVERFVDTLKRQMKKCARDDPHWVQNSLLAYRTTPNASLNGRTPAELFLGRPVRTVLSLIKPNSQKQKQGPVLNEKNSKMAKQFKIWTLTIRHKANSNRRHQTDHLAEFGSLTNRTNRSNRYNRLSRDGPRAKEKPHNSWTWT